MLGEQRFLLGDHLTEADWRLFTTLVRFDAVYYGHFKCNRRRIADYPNLSGYLRDLFQMPGVKETVNFEHIKEHYYYSHATINPTRIVPLGPLLILDAPHDRDRFRGTGLPTTLSRYQSTEGTAPVEHLAQARARRRRGVLPAAHRAGTRRARRSRHADRGASGYRLERRADEKRDVVAADRRAAFR